MKADSHFYANEINKNLSYDIKKKSILFYEAYTNKQIYGDVFAIYQAFFVDKNFADWNFIWTVNGTSGIAEELLDFNNDSRTELVSRGSVGLLKAFETSQIIIVGELLPSYYIKREGQLVIGVFSEDIYEPDGKLTKRRAAVQQTFAKLDVLYTDAAFSATEIERRYPSVTPFKVLEGAPLRYTLNKTGQANVVLSMSEALVGGGKNYANIERKYKDINYICSEYGKALLMQISYNIWNSCKDENAPEVLNYVRSDVYPICRMLHNAEVLVTDRRRDMLECIKMSRCCIFITNNISNYYEMYENNKEILELAGDWKEACDKLELFYKDDKESCAFDTSVAFYGMDNLLQEIAKLNCEENAVAKTDNHYNLLIVPSSLNRFAWKALKYFKPNSDVSVLVTGHADGKLWENTYDLDERINLFVKVGAVARGEDGHTSPVIMEHEWKRLIGNQQFETIYYIKTKDTLWNDMITCAPAKNTVVIPKAKFLKFLLESLDNPLLKSVKADNTTFHKISINEQEYYQIGIFGQDIFYLKCKREISSPSLVFINNKGDCKNIIELIEKEYSSETLFLLDPKRLMKSSKLIEKEKVYWLPIDILPAKLFLCSDTLVSCKDYVVRETALSIGKTLKDFAKVNIKEKADNKWELLAIDSEDEMI